MTSPHPLEPLSAAEIEAAAKSVAAAADLAPSARFVYVSLYPPAKAEVSRSKPAARPRAPGQGDNQGTGRTSHLRGDRRGRPRGTAVLAAGAGRAAVREFEEFGAAEEAVRADPRWRGAMRRRGVTDFSLCMIDPWSSPNLASEPASLGPDDGASSGRSPSSARARMTTGTPARSRGW